MKAQIQKFLREEDGITALEYGVLAAVIVVAVVLFAGQVSDWFGGLWDTISADLPNSGSGSGSGGSGGG